MQIEHLREFTVLAQLGSYTEAARHLYLTQPALSKHIGNIEKTLGVQLFKRGTNGVELTEAGRLFYSQALSIVNIYDQALEQISAMKETKSAVIRIGYLRDAARRFLMPLTKWFAREHPEVDLRFISIEYSQLARDLENHRVDAILTMDDDPSLHEHCEFMPLYNDSFMVAVGKEHPYAKRESLHFAELENSRLLVPKTDVWPNIRSFYNQHLSKETLAKAIEIDDVDTLFLLVESRVGIAIVASHNQRAYASKIAFVPLEDEGVPTFPVSAAWMKDARNDPISKRRVELLVQGLASIRENSEGA